MIFQKKPESSKMLDIKQWEDWNHTIFTLFWKLWVIILLVQLFLFIFFEPTVEISRLRYFFHYIFIPSGLEAVSLLVIWLAFTKLMPSRKRRVVSIYTILLITIFAGVTVCVHTSVKTLQALLILPMILTPLYKDKLMTLLQAVLVILLYILSYFYFVPKTSYLLPENAFTPYVELSVFIGGTMATCMILQRVNAAIVLNEECSKHDSLTHLYNHENFYVELDCYRSSFEKDGTPFSVLIADIDDFKKVNDTYGHAFGDEVICKVGELFAEIGKKDGFCARYGGEEFAMILPHCSPTAVGEQIRKAFENYTFETAEGNCHFTLSIGAAIYDKAYPNSSSFFEKADNALYYAKTHGKNCVVLNNGNEMSETE